MAELLSLDQLRTFLTIAESRSFTRAAERLYKSQPALSMQIKALEKQIGTELLNRAGRETTLTDAGRVLADYARRILDINDEALSKLSVVDTAGSVRVGVLEEAALGPLVRVLTQFGRLCTRIRIELEVSTSRELARRIESNELCLAVANSAFAKGPVEPLWDERYVWACSDDYEPPDGEPLQLIVDSLDYPCQSRDRVLEKLEDRGIHWQVVFSSLSLPALQAAVRARLGIAILAESALLPEMRTLGEQQGFPPIPSAEIALYRATEAASPASDSLYDFLLEHLRSGDVVTAG